MSITPGTYYVYDANATKQPAVVGVFTGGAFAPAHFALDANGTFITPALDTSVQTLIESQPAINGDGGALSHVTNFPSSFGVTGTLPAYAATPTFNLGTLNGAALDASVLAITAKLNAGVAVSGTFWQGVQPVSVSSLPLPAGAALESGGNLAAILAKQPALNGDGGAATHVTNFPGGFGIIGTLPAYASTPTFNLGTLNGAALDASVQAVLARLNGGIGLTAGAAAIGSVTQTAFALSNSEPVTCNATANSVSQVVPFSATRKVLHIFNRSAGGETVDIGSSNVVENGGIPLAPGGGGFTFLGQGAAGPIYAISPVASTPLSYVEG